MSVGLQCSPLLKPFWNGRCSRTFFKFCFRGHTGEITSVKLFVAKFSVCSIEMDSTLLKNIYRMQFAYFPKLLKRFFSSGLYNVGEINVNSLQFFLPVISLLSSVFSIKKSVTQCISDCSLTCGFLFITL